MFGASELITLVLAFQAIEPLPDGAIQSWSVSALPMAWRAERQTQSGSGGKTCIVVSLHKNVTVRFFKEHTGARARVSVRIGFDNQPASLRYLRVNRKIFQIDEDSFVGSVATDIVERLKLPGVFAFEWARRPDYAKRQGLFGTGDFAGRAEECLRWLDGKRVLQFPRALRVESGQREPNAGGSILLPVGHLLFSPENFCYGCLES